MAWRGAYDALHTYQANDAVVHDGRGFHAIQETTGNAPPAYPATTSAYWQLFAERGVDGVDGIDGVKNWWDELPGTPTRVSDTSFSITDAGNANLYDQRFPAGTIISWQKYLGGRQDARGVPYAIAYGDAMFYTGAYICAARQNAVAPPPPGLCPNGCRINDIQLRNYAVSAKEEMDTYLFQMGYI